MDLEQLGTELRRQRRARRMSGTELARRIGISPTYVWLIERARPRSGGEPSRPSEDVLADWTRALGIDEAEAQRLGELAGYASTSSAMLAATPPVIYEERANFQLLTSRPPQDIGFSATSAPPRLFSSHRSREHPDPVELERSVIAATRRLLRQAESAGQLDETVELLASYHEWLEYRIDHS